MISEVNPTANAAVRPAASPARAGAPGSRGSSPAEPEPRESEPLFRSLCAMAPFGVFQTDADGRMTDASARWHAISGLTLEESLGDGWRRAIHPDDRSRFLDEWARAMRERIEFSCEHRILTPQGVLRWVLCRAAVMPSDDAKRSGFVGTVQDITERKRAEEALRESEERLRFALRAANMVAWDWNLTSGRMVRSEGLPELPGMSSHRSHLFFGRVHPEDRAAVDRALAEALAAETPYDVEFRVLGNDGQVFWMRDRAQVTFDADRPVRMAGICVDITEHKRTTAALHAGEKRFRALVEKSWDGVALIAPNGTIEYASPATFRLLGCTSGETAAPHVFERVSPNDLPGICALFEELTAQPNASVTCEYRNGHRDGSWHWIEATCTNLLADAGVRAIVANFRDITERKQAEAALRESEERQRFALEARRAGVWELNLATGTVRWSDHLHRLFGLDPGAYDGTQEAFLERLHPEDREAVAQAMALALAEERGADMEFRIVWPDGTVRWIEDRSQHRPAESGVPARVVGVAMDVTERKRAEERLKASAAQLERSNRELQEFAYVASHDLQEPLRKIEAFGDRLKAKYGEVLGAEGNDYLERMQKASSRMRTLINDLLAFSRVTTQARPFVAVDLAEVAREVVSDLEARIEQTGGSVLLGELPTLEADPVQMRQLLQNLIGNALKFHGEEQAPVVKVYGRFLGCQAFRGANGEDGAVGADRTPEPMIARTPERLYQLSVEDSGIGFEQKYAERIFNSFQRLHGRGEYEGTGIGLAICRKIAERHGGRITAMSSPGHGATFRITLPVSQPKGEGSDA